jgi:O-antigen ligase
MDIGEETLAYGIASIITYVLFLIWSQSTAPSGEAKVPAFGEVIPLASTLMLAYSISNVVAENIFKNQNRPDFLKLVGYTFCCGIVIYSFITLGSFCKHCLTQPS